MTEWEIAREEFNQASAAMIEKIQRSGDMELANKFDRFTSATLKLIEMKHGN